MRTTTSGRAALALIAAAALSLTLLTAPTLAAPAAPADRQVADRSLRVAACWPGCWGAISFNTRTGVSGGKNDVGGKDAAIRKALTRCRSKPANQLAPAACVSPRRHDLYVKNACIEVWYRERNGRVVEWAKGRHFYQARARRVAKRQLDGPGEIKRSAWLCTTRRADYPSVP